AYPSYTINGREESQGYSSYRADSERVEVLANVFPVFLFAVAALVSLTTMMRFVEEERTNIGTLKALGY
ncbi:ABC transporter permease, partial [Clostridium butyricum]|nr:ABC transporter permease [Clostridium butyricum]